MTQTRKARLLVSGIVATVIGGFWFLAMFGDYRGVKTYQQQLGRQPRDSWPKESVAEAVVVRLPPPLGRTESERQELAAVGVRLSELLSDSPLGQFDGVECIRKRCALYLYGPDAKV